MRLLLLILFSVSTIESFSQAKFSLQAYDMEFKFKRNAHIAWIRLPFVQKPAGGQFKSKLRHYRLRLEDLMIPQQLNVYALRISRSGNELFKMPKNNNDTERDWEFWCQNSVKQGGCFFEKDDKEYWLIVFSINEPDLSSISYLDSFDGLVSLVDAKFKDRFQWLNSDSIKNLSCQFKFNINSTYITPVQNVLKQKIES